MPRRPQPKEQRHRKSPDAGALSVGRRVKLLRREAGMSFSELVAESGLGRGYISELERGLVVPGLHALQKLAGALEVTTADLVLGDSVREELFDATRGMTDAEVTRLAKEAKSP